MWFRQADDLMKTIGKALLKIFGRHVPCVLIVDSDLVFYGYTTSDERFREIIQEMYENVRMDSTQTS